MSLQEALAVVKTAGYRVSKPRAVTARKRPGLNALGLPMSVLYDPKYKIKYRTPRAAYATSTAGRRDALYAYKQCIVSKHHDPAVFNEIFTRQGIK